MPLILNATFHELFDLQNDVFSITPRQTTWQVFEIISKGISTIYVANIMDASELATQGIRASAAKVLTLFLRNILPSEPQGLREECEVLVTNVNAFGVNP